MADNGESNYKDVDWEYSDGECLKFAIIAIDGDEWARSLKEEGAFH